MNVSDLPALNATLNGCATILLTLGYVFIRQGQKDRHRLCMLLAFACSCIFLISYVTHKILVGGVHTPLGATGWILSVYRVMLASHILLAMAVVPLAILTIRRGLAGMVENHRKIARWTWPIWMYVSVTGVVIYLALYHWFPAKS